MPTDTIILLYIRKVFFFFFPHLILNRYMHWVSSYWLGFSIGGPWMFLFCWVIIKLIIIERKLLIRSSNVVSFGLFLLEWILAREDFNNVRCLNRNQDLDFSVFSQFMAFNLTPWLQNTFWNYAKCKICLLTIVLCFFTMPVFLLVWLSGTTMLYKTN